MYCDFLDYKGGFLSGSWYCTKKKDHIDKHTKDKYCDNSLRYRDCPIYRESGYSSGCYITTAVCDILGYNDNCEELETLRSFRENWMKSEENKERCLPILEDYKIVGREISNKLFFDPDKEKKAGIILDLYIKPAITNINEEKYEEALEIYETMTFNLIDHYKIDDSILIGDYTNLNKGIQRKRKNI